MEPPFHSRRSGTKPSESRDVHGTLPRCPSLKDRRLNLGIAKTSTYHFLECLERGRLLQRVAMAGTGLQSVRKPEKVYLDNTNLLAAITNPQRAEPAIGRRFLVPQQMAQSDCPKHEGAQGLQPRGPR